MTAEARVVENTSAEEHASVPSLGNEVEEKLTQALQVFDRALRGGNEMPSDSTVGEFTLDTPFGERMLTSYQLGILSQTIGDLLGMALPQTLIFEYPNVRDIANHLLEEPASTDVQVPEPESEPVQSEPVQASVDSTPAGDKPAEGKSEARPSKLQARSHRFRKHR